MGLKSFEFSRGISSTRESDNCASHTLDVRPPRYRFQIVKAGGTGV